MCILLALFVKDNELWLLAYGNLTCSSVWLMQHTFERASGSPVDRHLLATYPDVLFYVPFC